MTSYEKKEQPGTKNDSTAVVAKDRKMEPEKLNRIAAEKVGRSSLFSYRFCGAVFPQVLSNKVLLLIWSTYADSHCYLSGYVLVYFHIFLGKTADFLNSLFCNLQTSFGI